MAGRHLLCSSELVKEWVTFDERRAQGNSERYIRLPEGTVLSKLEMYSTASGDESNDWLDLRDSVIGGVKTQLCDEYEPSKQGHSGLPGP